MISLPIAVTVGVVCVLVEAFFSGSEIAMVSADRSQLRHRASGGDRGARLVEAFLAKPQALLATTLLGTNLATVTFSVTVALFLMGRAGSHSELWAIVMVTPATLLFGEVVPKTLFQQYANQIVTRIIFPLRFASILLRPIVLIMSWVASAMTRLLGTDQERAFITRDELVVLIENDSGASEITEDERAMIANVFELSEATADEVMVPLSEVTALPEDVTLGEAALEVADKQHSRMPIYESRVDNIVGIVHVFDLLAAGITAKRNPVRSIAKPATFVPESKPASELLVELQRTGNQMAIVVDEYGGAVGIVTVEDILEEIVGEIEDEYDEALPRIEQERPGVWRVEARTSVQRLNQELALGLPESEEYESGCGVDP